MVHTLKNGKKMMKVNLSFYINEEDLIQVVAQNITRNLSKKKLLDIVKFKLLQSGNDALSHTDCSLPLLKAKKQLHKLLPEIKKNEEFSVN